MNGAIMKRALITVLIAFSSLHCVASTLQERQAMQSELEQAEYQDKLDKLKSGGGRGSPVATTRSEANESGPASLSLVGIIGIGEALKAIVRINGAEVMLGTGETVLGYKAISVMDKEVKLMKINAKGNAAGKEIELILVGSSTEMATQHGQQQMKLPPVPTGYGGIHQMVNSSPIAADTFEAPPQPTPMPSQGQGVMQRPY